MRQDTITPKLSQDDFEKSLQCILVENKINPYDNELQNHELLNRILEEDMKIYFNRNYFHHTLSAKLIRALLSTSHK